MEEVLGARLEDHAPASEVALRIVEDFGGLKSGDTFHFTAGSGPRQWPAILALRGGRVVALDQAGRPALIAHSVGSGKTLLCAYPIESYLAAQPSAFDNDQTTHRIYRAFRNWAGVRPAFETDSASVEVSSLNDSEHGYVVLANHGGRRQVLLSSSIPLKSVALVSGSGLRPLVAEAQGWRVDIEAYDGAVVEWRR
jgi:beta-glucosidase